MSNRLKNLYKTCGPGLPNLKHSQIKASGKLSSHISDTGIGIVLHRSSVKMSTHFIRPGLMPDDLLHKIKTMSSLKKLQNKGIVQVWMFGLAVYIYGRS